MNDTNNDNFDAFLSTTPKVSQNLVTVMGEDTSPTPYTPKAPKDLAATMGQDKFTIPTTPFDNIRLMEDYAPKMPDTESRDLDVSLQVAEVSNTQESSQLLSPEALTPQLPRPTSLKSLNNLETSTTLKPETFKPATPISRASRPSIFGPPIDHDKYSRMHLENEDTSDVKADVQDATTPYSEPIQSYAMFTTPIRSSRKRPPNAPPSRNQVNFPTHQALNKQIDVFQPQSTCGGSDDGSDYGQALRNQNSDFQQASMDSDSDDNLCIIHFAEASKEAKDRWAEPRNIVEIEDDDQNVKSEPESDDEHSAPRSLPNNAFPASNTFDMASIVAKQRAMVNKNKTPREDPMSEAIRHPRLAARESPYVTNNKKRRLSGHYNVPEDPEEVNAAMCADSDGDHSWMNEEPDGDREQEIHLLQENVNMLTRREKNGKISENEVFELGRLRKKLTLQKRLLLCAQGSPSRQPKEQSLFLPADREEILRDHRRAQHARNSARTPLSGLEDDSNDDSFANWPSPSCSDPAIAHMLEAELEGDGIDGPATEKEITKTKKPRKKVAKNAREYYARQQEEQREKERVKAQKAKARGVKVGARKPATKGKAAGKKSKAGAKSGKLIATNQPRPLNFRQNDGIDEIGQMIINDLMNDPIADRLQDPIFKVGPEPEMQGNHLKTTQLQRLLANIPEGSDTKEAKSDRARLKQAAASFGFAKVKAVDGKWLIKGMKSTLYHHQLLGAQWMIQRELSDEAPYGGLLTDGMGLGKTVQTLACMVGNPPNEKDCNRGVKATLIVVPSSVIDQWLDEIRNHVEVACFPKIMHYRASAKIPIEVLRDLDIVVCSYHEVMNQMPFPDQDDREAIRRLGYKKWWKKARLSMGDLFAVSWYRVVLDEAHAIKNNSARTSLACQNLRSIYRWCLTGTPILNRLEELFPYLRFLKANYSMEWKTFQRYFCDPNATDCINRIDILLSYTMMRRTMKTTILNRPIITLPTPHPEVRFVEFSAEERIIYRITENRFRATLNGYFKNGTANKAYAVFLVQLLRLRQCTSHPFMLEQTIRESWTSSDLKELRSKLDRLGKFNMPFYEKCAVWVTKSDEERKAVAERGEDSADGETMPFGVGDYGYQFDIAQALKTLSEKELYSRVTCSLCSDLPRQPVVTDCNHIFCKECLTDYMHFAAATGDDEFLVCPACEKIFVSFKRYKGPRIADEESMNSESADLAESASERGSKRRKYGNRYSSQGSLHGDMLGFEPHVKNSTWVRKSDQGEFSLPPSVKTTALKSILLKGFQEAPLDKVVIYVQFRLLALIVGRICRSERWGFVYLTGDTALEQRKKVVKIFRENSDAKILIAGLRCGGLGLNFPWANRCISLDLWWNHAVEQQAFGRIFRIGQKKETYMTRIVVKNSVDMRLLTMQLHKLKACEKALDSNEDKQKRSLSLSELAELFGFLRTDEDGKILEILPDYRDDDEGVV